MAARARAPSQLEDAWGDTGAGGGTSLKSFTDFSDRQEEIMRRANLLKESPIFAARTTKELRLLAITMQSVEFGPGETVFAEGDAENGVFVLEKGACTVHVLGRGQLARMEEPGTLFGEIALFLEGPRTASVVAGKEGAVCLRAQSAEVLDILSDAWGGRDELARRAEILGKLDLFSGLRQAELMVLASVMQRIQFDRPGVQIVTECKQGDCMYLLDKGHPMVTVQKVGRLREMEPGECFGELAILQAPRNWRTATITTTDLCTVVFSLSQRDVFRLIPEQRRAETLGSVNPHYDERMQLRTSQRCLQCIDKFWEASKHCSSQLLESANRNPNYWGSIRRTLGKGMITQAAYEQLSFRLTKVLCEEKDFSMKKAVKIAKRDWCEDITAFSGDCSSSVVIELIKKQITKRARAKVNSVGWHKVFQRCVCLPKHEQPPADSLSLSLWQFGYHPRNWLCGDRTRR